MTESDDELWGTAAIAKCMSCSDRHVRRLREQYAHVNPMPVVLRTVGRPPNRRRMLWTTRYWLRKWIFQIHYREGKP